MPAKLWLRGLLVQECLVHLVRGMTKKNREFVITNVLPVPSALEAQFNQYRVKPDNLAQLAMTNVRHVALAFIALLQKKKSFVHRAHIVKEMLQPVKIVKLDILVYKVIELFVQQVLSQIKLILRHVSSVLRDTIARVQVIRINTSIHANQEITAV